MEQPKRRDTQLGLGKGGLVDEDEHVPHATLPSGIVPSAPPGAVAAPSAPPGGTLPPPGSGPHPAVPNTGRPAPPSGRGASAPPSGPVTASAPPAPTSAAPASAPPASQKIPSRQPRSNRPIRVDDVGDTAVRIAAKTPRGVVPRVVASAKVASAAPRGPRDAFVLSLVDGHTTLQAIVDMAGMPEDEVMTIVDHLCRSGIISLG